MAPSHGKCVHKVEVDEERQVLVCRVCYREWMVMADGSVMPILGWVRMDVSFFKEKDDAGT